VSSNGNRLRVTQPSHSSCSLETRYLNLDRVYYLLTGGQEQEESSITTVELSVMSMPHTMWTFRSNRCRIDSTRPCRASPWAAIRIPRRCSGSLARTPPSRVARHGFPRLTLLTQLDRDGEAVGGTLALRGDENLIVEFM
jgi:hypothetical protein